MKDNPINPRELIYKNLKCITFDLKDLQILAKVSIRPIKSVIANPFYLLQLSIYKHLKVKSSNFINRYSVYTVTEIRPMLLVYIRLVYIIIYQTQNIPIRYHARVQEKIRFKFEIIKNATFVNYSYYILYFSERYLMIILN